MSEYRGKRYRYKNGIFSISRFLDTDLYAFTLTISGKIVRSFPTSENPKELQTQLDLFATQRGYQEVQS